MLNKKLQIALLSTVFTLLDLATKIIATGNLKTPIKITNWLYLRYSENPGIAWSLPIPPIIIYPLNLALIGLLIYYAFTAFDLKKYQSILFFSLILGGAIGNLTDRIINGYVTDFIDIGFWPIFNLADCFISAGIFLLILFYGRIKRTL